MPLLLNTPKSTGDLDPQNASYTHVKIILTKHNAVSQTIDLVCRYGVADGYGNWTDGLLTPQVHVVDGVNYGVVLGSDPSGES
jgi:hypothetical protein